MSRFPPESSVLTSVKMTRTAYAQLVGQKFYPPKIFGRWNEKEGTPERRWREVGMKLVGSSTARVDLRSSFALGLRFRNALPGDEEDSSV